MEPRIITFPFGDRSYKSTLYYGQDNRVSLRSLPEKSVQCVVTSPPYWGLRDYGTAKWEGGDPICTHEPPPEWSNWYEHNRQQAAARMAWYNADRSCRCGAVRVDDQLGMEDSPEAFAANLVDVFREVRRVLRDDGTVWLNLGDSYATTAVGSFNGGGFKDGANRDMGGVATSAGMDKVKASGLKPKDLVGIPWLVAFALRADGWFLRSDIIWAKGSCMPENIYDRPTKSHEYVFLLAKCREYYYDQEAIREPIKPGNTGRVAVVEKAGGTAFDDEGKPIQAFREYDEIKGANKRSVWHINPRPYAGAHFATYPPALVEPCIKAGTSAVGCCPSCGAPWVRVIDKGPRAPEPVNRNPVERLDPGQAGNVGVGNMGFLASRLSGQELTAWKAAHPDVTRGWESGCKCPEHVPVPCTVLDTFSGSATTGYKANRLGRDYIGLDLNPSYLPLAEARILGNDPLDADDGAAPAESILDLFGA